jgi:hypothetical protein
MSVHPIHVAGRMQAMNVTVASLDMEDFWELSGSAIPAPISRVLMRSKPRDPRLTCYPVSKAVGSPRRSELHSSAALESNPRGERVVSVYGGKEPAETVSAGSFAKPLIRLRAR